MPTLTHSPGEPCSQTSTASLWSHVHPQELHVIHLQHMFQAHLPGGLIEMR